MKKRFLSILLLCLIVPTISVAAATGGKETRGVILGGSGYQYVYYSVASIGRVSCDMRYGSQKTDTASTAVMFGEHSLLLNPSAQFVTIDNKYAANKTTLPNNKRNDVPLYSGSSNKGVVLYTEARSHPLEPNTIKVTVKFSANNLR